MLQTKDGRPAKRMATQEFRSFTEKVIKATLDCQKKHPGLYPDGHPYFSMDNATWHDVGDLQVVPGIKLKECLLPLPPQSPDLHKVIEHAINRVKSAMRADIAGDPRRLTAEELRGMFAKHFADMNKPEMVERDIQTLKKTFKAVGRSEGKGGTAGGWAPVGLN